MQKVCLAFVGLLVASLVACSAPPRREASLEGKLTDIGFRTVEPVDRIHRFKIKGWNYIDDYHVVFRGGPSADYLITFRQRCINLRSALAISFSSTAGDVTQFDAVYVKHRSSLAPERCQIDAMHRLEKSG